MARPIFQPGIIAARDVGDPICTNLLTGPSFEAGLGTAVVRTNRALDPRATTSNVSGTNRIGWAAGSYGSGTGAHELVSGVSDGPQVSPGRYLTSYMRKEWTTGSAVSTGMGLIHTSGAGGGPGSANDGLVVAPGEEWTVSTYLRVISSSASGVVMRVWFRTSAGTYVSATASSTTSTSNGIWKRLTFTFTVPAGVARACFASEVASGTLDDGDTFDGTGLLVEKTSAALPYFDPADGVGDPDFSAVWTGVANNSSSQLRGVGTTGTFGGFNAVPVKSSSWSREGNSSLRIVDTSSAPASVALYTFSAGDVGKEFTVVGHCRLAAALTGSEVDRSRRLFLLSPTDISGPQAPNTAGVHEVRWTFTVTTAGQTLHAGGGRGAGRGDVWWDVLTLVEGEYDGPAFTGDTQGDDDYEYVWTGVEHASTSVQHEVSWVEVAATIPPPVASVVVIASPPSPPPNPAVVPGWDRMRVTWIGTDGSVWRLDDPDRGVFLVRSGLRGLGMLKPTHYRDKSPALPGAVYRDTSYDSRNAFWAVHLYHDGSSREWVERDRAFWDSLHPRGTGVLTVEVPGVSRRSIRLRLEDDGDWAPEVDPTFYGWANYGINLQADDPFWYGTPIVREFRVNDPLPFFGGTEPGAPIFNITPDNSDVGMFPNPGDEDAWPLVTIHGPFTGASVTINGKTITVPFALAEGKSLTLDYHPEQRTAIDSDGQDRYEDLSNRGWGFIPYKSSAEVEASVTGDGYAVVQVNPVYLRAW